MRKIQIIFILLSFVVINIYGAETESDKTELLRLEKVWNDAHLNGNAEALEAIWADDLTVIVPKMQVLTKTDALAFARSGKMKFQKYETTDIQSRIYGDTAIVTGRLQRTRTMNDKEISDDWRFTKVYIRSSGKWRVVSWQASEWPQQ
jgi:ketosteroid isomerase-like protein